MKLHYALLSLCLCGWGLSSCNNEMEDLSTDGQAQIISPSSSSNDFFAPDDGAVSLSGTPADILSRLLQKVDVEMLRPIAYQNITKEQYDEIKTFTDELVGTTKDELTVYNKIFRWVVANIKYELSDNDPYPVFVNRKGICQGYANLLTVMLHSQGIIVMNVNGYLDPIGGHAWNYVYAGGNWIVSDPTNGGSFAMTSVSTYRHLVPYSTAMSLFEDEMFAYDFQDCRLNVNRVKVADSRLTVPFSVAGFQVKSFNPSAPLPDNVMEVYIGKNIETLGESYLGLSDSAPNMVAAHVHEDNGMLESHKGIVYKKNGSERQIYYIPAHISLIELMVMERVEKNTIYNCMHVTEIVFPKGVKVIESFAVENCPQLHTVYVPADAIIQEEAFSRCPSDLQIIRGDYTGIDNVVL